MRAKKTISALLASAMTFSCVGVMPQALAQGEEYGTVTDTSGAVVLNFGNESITTSGGGSIITDTVNGGVLRPDNLRTDDNNLAVLTLPEVDLNNSGYNKIDILAASKNDASVVVKAGDTEIASFANVNSGAWDSYQVNTADLTTTEASGNITLNITGSSSKTYCGNYVYVRLYNSSVPQETNPPASTPTTGEEPEEGLLPYQDESLSFEERAADLVSRMTLEEKVSQIGYKAAAIERLGVSAYDYWKEALHGVARQGQATSFPSPLSMSNTWNRALIYQIADITSTEARAKNNRYNLSYWSPTVNMARDPRWGRNEETMGEDPYLTGQLGAEFVKGMQGDDEKYLKTISTLKHFAANNNETNRRGGSSVMNEYNFRNYYAKVFENIAEQIMPASFMSSYNAITLYRNGELLYNYVPSAANSYLLTDLLRRNWGFDGYVTTDCGAGEDLIKNSAYKKGMLGRDDVPSEQAVAQAYLAGLNLECSLSGGNASTTYGVDAVKNGYLSEDKLDTAVYELFLQRFKTGEFDNDSEYRDINKNVIESDEHVAVAEEAAEESWVLLKNDDDILPLTEDDKNIAVVGARASEVILGDYSGTPTKTVNPVDGITEEIQKKYPDSKVSYLGGVSNTTPLFNIKSISLVDESGKKTNLDLSKAQIEGASYEDGIIKDVTKNASIVIPDVDFSKAKNISMEIATGSQAGGKISVHYGKGGPIGASIESSATDSTDTYAECVGAYTGADGGYGGTADMELTIEANTPTFSIDKYKSDLDNADVIIAYASTMWGSGGDASESHDRADIDLPDTQSHVQAIAEAYPEKTVVVMQAVGQINVEPFMDKCKAILWTSYNGQTQGTAIGKVLSGEVNPSGRLTTTWYKNADVEKMELANRSKQTIDGIEGYYTDYNIQADGTNPGHTYQYYQNTPVYPFGYGLSYTSFEYSNITADKSEADANGNIKFTADVKNTGNTKGKEVVQLYISHPQTDGMIPAKQLKGFEKIELEPQETKTVEFNINVKDLSLFSEEEQKNYVPVGEYTAYIGKNASDSELSKTFTVSGALESKLDNVRALPDGVVLKGLICEDGTGLEAVNKINSGVSAIMSDDVWVDLKNAEVKYESSDTAVASVDDEGVVVSGNKEGVAQITVTVTVDGVTESDSYPVVNQLSIKPSDADIENALTELKAAYDKLPQGAYSEANLAEINKVYNEAVENIKAVSTKTDLEKILAAAINSLNSVTMDNLNDVYSIVSENPNYIEKGVIDYREGGIPPYSGAVGTVTNVNPYSGIQLKAYDENGDEIDSSKIVWQVRKFDDSVRKVADIDSQTGELTIYGNGIIQIIAANIEDMSCGKLMVQVNMQIEGEYADEANGADLTDAQSGSSGGHDAGSTGNVWMEYKSVKLSNLEDIIVRYAGKNAGVINVSLDKSISPDKLVASAQLNATGGWSTWSNATLSVNSEVIDNAQLSGLLDEYGCATVYIQTNGTNLDYFRLNYMENNDEIPYIIEKTLNKTNGRIKATLKYRGSTLAVPVQLMAEVLNSDGTVKNTVYTEVCGSGEYEIATGASEGENVRLTVCDENKNSLSESVEKLYREPVDSKIVVYSLDSTDYDYSVLSGGTDEVPYTDTVNGLSGYGSWSIKENSASYTYTDVNEKTYDYKFTKTWNAGQGSETKRSLYFTPESACKVTVLFNGNVGRDMYISQNGERLATGIGSGQDVAFSAEITDTSSPVYIYGGNSGKNLYAIIVEYYGAQEEDPVQTTPPAETTPPEETEPPIETTPPVETASPVSGTISYNDGKAVITADADMRAKLIHASYDAGAFTGVRISDIKLIKDTPVEVEVNGVQNGDKLMVWNSLEDMTPVTEALTVSVEESNVQISAAEGQDIAVQYTNWGEGEVLLTRNDVTGETKVWSILPGNLRIELSTDMFYESDIDYQYGDKLTINKLQEYKDRLYAGCDDGLVIVFTDCVKCYKLKKVCDFDIKEMEIADGIMYVSDGQNEEEIDMRDIGADSIEADEARVLANNGGVLVDVRSAEEFAQESAEGAVNIPVDELENGLSEYDKDTVLIFFCSSGTRSETAMEIAKEMGFTNIYNLGSVDKLL